MRVIFTPLAERHIDSLHEYIAMPASEERADGYVGRIIDSTFPLRGTQSDDLLSGLRVTGFERRVTIGFIVTADVVLIEGISMAAGTLRRSFAVAREISLALTLASANGTRWEHFQISVTDA